MNGLETLVQGIFPYVAPAFHAELWAICKACEIAREIAAKTAIWTDSLASIKLLKGEKANPVADHIRSILRGNRRISINWVPSHVGIRGNEAADSAAKDALQLPLVAEVPPLPDLFLKWARIQYEEEKLQEWSRTGTFLSTHWPKITKPNYNRQLPKFWARKLLRLRIGHCRLTKGHLLSPNEQVATCPHCGTACTIEHVLRDCSLIRNFLPSDSPNVQQILNPSQPFPSPLYNYLKSTNLIHKI